MSGRTIVIVIAIAAAGVLVFLLARGGESEVSETPALVAGLTDIKEASPTSPAGPPSMEIDVSKRYQAILQTSVGEITIELSAAQTSITVNNFIHLARRGFYDKTIFHRVLKGFMIQGGDPKGDGTGGPGYKFADEPFGGEYTRGTVAMANAGPNTNGSQFFIMHQDYNLPKNYVIFGKVAAGLEVVDKIAKAATKLNPVTGENSRPVVPVIINSVQIIEE